MTGNLVMHSSSGALMAEAITSNHYRRKLATAMAGGAPIARITEMAFGDGGWNDSTEAVIPPDPEQVGLNHELLRKPLSLVTQETEFSCTGRGVLDEDELIGYKISEAALFDEDGTIVGIKNFGPKLKESDEEYETNIKLRY
jgi:phage-related tail fiber protein